jgi:plasmid stability protein
MFPSTVLLPREHRSVRGTLGQAGQVRAAAAAALVADAVQVGADGADADEQLLGDLRVGLPQATRVTRSRSRELSSAGPGSTVGSGSRSPVIMIANSAAAASVIAVPRSCAANGSIIGSMVELNICNVPEPVAAALRERASRHGRSLQQELLAILEAAAAEPMSAMTALSPVELKSVRTVGSSSWSRGEIYGHEAR